VPAPGEPQGQGNRFTVRAGCPRLRLPTAGCARGPAVLPEGHIQHAGHTYRGSSQRVVTEGRHRGSSQRVVTEGRHRGSSQRVVTEGRHRGSSPTRQRPTRSCSTGCPAAWHRTEQYANNHVEADNHGRLKARLRPMRGLKQDRSAKVIIAGHASCRTSAAALRVGGGGDGKTGGWPSRSVSWPWRSELRRWSRLQPAAEWPDQHGLRNPTGCLRGSGSGRSVGLTGAGITCARPAP